MADETGEAPGTEEIEILRKKVRDLGHCMEVSAIISSTLDFNELMTLVMEKSKEVMNAEACSLLLYNKETRMLEFRLAICEEACKSDVLRHKVTLKLGEGIAGWVAQHREPLLVRNAAEDPRFFDGADKLTNISTKSLIAVPLIGRTGLIGVAEILNPKQKEFFEEYDLEMFQFFARQVSVALENAVFHRESLEQQRLKQEMEIASAIQRSFLPEEPELRSGRITLRALNISAANVGGDFYDFTEPGPGRAGLMIGDISGKGVSGALYMAKVISDFRYIARSEGSSSVAFDRLGAQMAGAPRGMFLTAAYVIADCATGELEISLAGHPPPILMDSAGVRVLELPAGPPLGIITGAEYTHGTFRLLPGQSIILVTDGAFEAKDLSGRRLGFQSMVSFLRRSAGRDSHIRALVEHVKRFSAGTEMADDLTVAEISFGPEDAGQ